MSSSPGTLDEKYRRLLEVIAEHGPVAVALVPGGGVGAWLGFCGLFAAAALAKVAAALLIWPLLRVEDRPARVR